MKQKKFKYIIIAFCFCVGTMVFFLQKNWLIIYWNFGDFIDCAPIQKNTVSDRKKVKIYFCQDGKFKHEEAVVIWNCESNSENLKHIINAWLTMQLDEKVFSKKIELEYVAVAPQSQEAFISFGQIFSWGEWSIFKKYKLIESLLKTIQAVDLDIKHVIFLVNSKHMEDSHLNFINPWPIDGF